MLSAQAPGAHSDPFFDAVHYQRGSDNVRQPSPLGATIRMANIMPELNILPANLTFHSCSFDLSGYLAVEFLYKHTIIAAA